MWATDWCGSGILDFGKIQAPISGAKMTGEAVIGEPLHGDFGHLERQPGFKYVWLRDGATPARRNGNYATA